MVERREDGTRAPIKLRVDYKRLNTFFADYTKNISKGGTFVHTTRPLDVGTSFVFVLALPGATAGAPPRELELSGIVKWVVLEGEAGEDNPAGMGIEFVFADDSEREKVAGVVTDLMRDALGPRLADKLLGS